jgi:hypothetical protein
MMVYKYQDTYVAHQDGLVAVSPYRMLDIQMALNLVEHECGRN